MMDRTSLVFLYTETPLHAGSGAALGAVDLPVQRERMSKLPMVQGSGIKGALRAELKGRQQGEGAWTDFDRALFGREPPKRGQKEDEQAEDKAGALSLLDARLLLLPVRTVWGGFAWITSPLILQRLARDLEIAQIPHPWSPVEVDEGAAGTARVGPRATIAKNKSFLIEDLEYEAVEDPMIRTLAEWLATNAVPGTPGYKPFADRLPLQLAVVADSEMKDLAERATEVVTRVRIEQETGVVADGALWTEESLPAETLLWSLMFFTREREGKEPPQSDRNGKTTPKPSREPYDAQKLQREVRTKLDAMTRIRLGGDRTVGRGIVGIRMYDRGEP
jgi:CRISPR-associated protein Cmr4